MLLSPVSQAATRAATQAAFDPLLEEHQSLWLQGGQPVTPPAPDSDASLAADLTIDVNPKKLSPSALASAPLLPAAAALQRLWLDRNRFGPRGCRALAEAASQHGCALHELRLGGNARLSTADVASLAKLGEPNPERTSGQLRLKLQMAG